MLAAIEQFLAGLREEPTEPNLILTTVLDAEVPEAEQGIAALGGRPLPRRSCSTRRTAASARPSTAPPAPCAARARWPRSMPQLRAGVHTGECELRDGRLAGPALEIAAGVARAAADGRDPRHLDRAGPRRAARGIEFTERGAVELPLAGTSREWRLFTVER